MLSNRWSGVLRGLVIVAVLGVWLAIGAIGGQAQGKLSTVQTNDSAAFLPSSAESTRAAEKAQAFVSDESLPALVVAVPTAGERSRPSSSSSSRTSLRTCPACPCPAPDPTTPRPSGTRSRGTPSSCPRRTGRRP